MLLTDGPSDAPLTLLFAHGAGAPMDSPFMDFFAQQLAQRGWKVLRFEFPYMVKRRQDGKKRPPDRQPVLLECFAAHLSELVPSQTVLMGKSMGGRMASMIADEAGVSGLICLGYPFHPPGKPEKLRTAHLEYLKTPALICQGERDTLGNRATVSTLPLSRAISSVWLPDGDHGFKPRKASGFTEAQNWQVSVGAIHGFLKGLR